MGELLQTKLLNRNSLIQGVYNLSKFVWCLMPMVVAPTMVGAEESNL